MTGMVYIPQETRRRMPDMSWESVHDFTTADKFGTIEILLPPGPVMICTDAMTRTLRYKLRNFSDADYVVGTGDPAAIGVICAIAAEVNYGRFSMLRWDRKLKEYLPIEILTKG